MERRILPRTKCFISKMKISVCGCKRSRGSWWSFSIEQIAQKSWSIWQIWNLTSHSKGKWTSCKLIKCLPVLGYVYMSLWPSLREWLIVKCMTWVWFAFASCPIYLFLKWFSLIFSPFLCKVHFTWKLLEYILWF